MNDSVIPCFLHVPVRTSFDSSLRLQGKGDVQRTCGVPPKQHHAHGLCAGNSADTRCTVAYAAPELLVAQQQRSSVTAQPAQDVYALGLIVFEALTHARALPACGACAAAAAAAAGAQRYPWEAAEDQLSPAFGRSKLRGTLAACLARNPAERPTAAQLCEQLISIGDATVSRAGEAGDDYFVLPPAAL